MTQQEQHCSELKALAALEVRAAQARLHALADERAQRTLGECVRRIVQLRERHPDYLGQPVYVDTKREFIKQARVPRATELV